MFSHQQSPDVNAVFKMQRRSLLWTFCILSSTENAPSISSGKKQQQKKQGDVADVAETFGNFYLADGLEASRSLFPRSV